MEREWLRERLEAGASMEVIAREAGKSASTVAYWVNKHGLVSTHAERHQPRGPIPEEVLADMAARGLSIRKMAAELGRSYSAVRHWLTRYGIETDRAARLADTATARAQGLREADAVCHRHGRTRFVQMTGAFRCAKCRQEAVIEHRRGLKQKLVAEAGGACVLCGYGRCIAALQFHHVDPATKEFGIGRGGSIISIDVLREEARKCVLLCANCHAEVEAGVANLPAVPADSPG